MKYLPLLAAILVAGLLTSCRQETKKEPVEISLKMPDHIVVVIEENHGYDQIVGAPSAPYINELMSESAVFTDAHGVTHPSQPNYLALFSGSTQGIPADQCLFDLTPYSTPNLGAALIAKGYTFKGFAQSMPAPGFLECDYLISQLTGGVVYGRKHCPWVNWQGNKSNNFPDSLSQPMTAFPKDFNQLPTVTFVVPDMDHDMHNIGKPGDPAAISRGDQWLKENIGAYVEWAKTHNSLLIFTFDEDQFTPRNRILTMFAGGNINPGKYAEKINHYNVLHTIEKMYGLPFSNTGDSSTIAGIWKN
jgi:hypothetical protein